MESILKDFYRVEKLSNDDSGNFTAEIKLNPSHNIFKGHFPGNPVTPGVCMMQIVKDLTEKCTAEKLFLKSASNVKFMSVINPEENPDLMIQLNIKTEENIIKVKSTTLFGETIALKMSAQYQKIP
ncbi:3-hydroxyacyl-ACP dehydratase [Chryseobacterium sp. Leaf180]|uniref:3-hydroxyacyl-ACP dehydratase n=1 Tax=Chryseobacterium sp. Leaf180 TaxID=1736289 RepID=UPI0009E846C5|nr:3-hydroxyacyl-ACP dehydratase [Chryseobacterium sp. Leaf180]